MRLSRLEKCILGNIANHTVNFYECEGCFYQYRPCRPEWEDFNVSNKDLLALAWSCYRGEDVSLGGDARVSFSRALHRLVEKKGLVKAYALAWYHIGLEQDFACWQGGRKDDTPVYRLLGLTDKGWEVARDLLGPEVGKCSRRR